MAAAALIDEEETAILGDFKDILNNFNKTSDVELVLYSHGRAFDDDFNVVFSLIIFTPNLNEFELHFPNGYLNRTADYRFTVETSRPALQSQWLPKMRHYMNEEREEALSMSDVLKQCAKLWKEQQEVEYDTIMVGPSADEAELRYHFRFFAGYNYNYDKTEKKILKAIERDNLNHAVLEAISELDDTKIVDFRRQLVAYAISVDAVKSLDNLLINGFNVRQRDEHGNTPLAAAVYRKMSSYDYYRNEPYGDFVMNAEQKRVIDRLDIIKILVNNYSSVNELFADIFLEKNRIGMTPFLYACCVGGDSLIRYFLDIYGNVISYPCVGEIPIRQISIDDFRGGYRNSNFLHFLMDASTRFTPTTNRLNTLDDLRSTIPFFAQFINEIDRYCKTPIHVLFNNVWNKNGRENQLALAGFLFASLDDSYRGDDNLLTTAVNRGDWRVTEVLMRGGCLSSISSEPGKPSPFFKCLHRRHGYRDVTRFVNLFLAFGVDLRNELAMIRRGDSGVDVASEVVDSLEILEQRVPRLTEICRDAWRRDKRATADRAIIDLGVDELPRELKDYLAHKPIPILFRWMPSNED